MKKINIIISLIALFWMVSCDVIDQPFEEKIEGPDTTKTDVVYKKILLEDYTGFNCPNCPRAAEVIHTILNTYNDNVIPVAIHAGYFAKPKTQASSPYKYDFRTTVGDEWDTYFGISAVGNPNGLVNRINSHKIYSFQEWLAQISENLSKISDFKIKLRATMNDAKSKINSEIEVTTLNNLTANYKLNVILIQDNIVDYQNNEGVDVADYVHNHVLRATFNGNWGEDIITSPAAKNTKIVKEYNLEVKKDDKHPWLKENLKVVAFIYDAQTYEVMQVEEIKVN